MIDLNEIKRCLNICKNTYLPLPENWKKVKGWCDLKLDYNGFKVHHRHTVNNVIYEIYELNDVLYIAFKGTDDLQDWSYNLDYELKKLTIPYDNKNSKIKVHTGFLKIYKMVRENIHNKIGTFKNIVVSGFSMGGAIAVLCSIDLQYNFNANIKCITFGSPRVGNKEFINSYNKRVEAVKIINKSDPIAKLPTRFMGYRNITEVIYNRNWIENILWNLPIIKFIPVWDHNLPTYL